MPIKDTSLDHIKLFTVYFSSIQMYCNAVNLTTIVLNKIINKKD